MPAEAPAPVCRAVEKMETIADGSAGGLSDRFLHRVVRAAAPVFTAKALAAGIGIVRGPMIAHYLTAERYGKLGMILGFVGLIGGLIGCRVWETVIKYLAEYRHAGDEPGAHALIGFCYTVDVLSGLTAFALCQALAVVGARFFFGDTGLDTLLRIYALILLVQMTDSTSTGLLRYFDKFTRASVIQAGVSLLRLGAAAVVVFGDFGLAGFVGVEIGCALVATLLTSWLVAVALVENGFAWRRFFSWAPLRPRMPQIGRFMLSTNLTATTRLASTSLDTLLVGKLAGPAAAGYYRLCRLIVDQAGIVIDAMSQVLFPMLARAYQNEHKRAELWSRLRRASFSMALPLAAIAGAMILCAGPVVRAFGGRDFASAAAGLQVMLVGLTIWGALLWVPALLLSADRSFWNTGANLVRAVVLLGGIILFAPTMGFMSAALAYTASIAAWGACSLFLVFKIKHQTPAHAQPT